MNDLTDHHRIKNQSPANADEESLLESVLTGSDRLLADSLREEERRRRRRRNVRFISLLGGLVMGTTLVAVMAGWLTLFNPPPADSPRTAASARPTELDEEERIAKGEELAAEGWELWKQRKLSEAARKFERAVALDPDAADAWNGLGWARFNGGDGDTAVEAFEKAVELEPKHPAALNGLGQVYLNIGDLDKAEKYLLKTASAASAAQFGLARLYLLKGEYDKSEKWAEKALSTQPGDATLTAMLDAARSKAIPPTLRQQLEPAGKPAAGQSGPADKAAAAGWRYFNEGKWRSAERSFQRALAKDPENLAAMNGLGFMLLNKGNTAEAKQYFEKYLEKEPDAPGPMNGLARCLKEEGKIDEAIALWEKMYKKYPGPNAAAVGLASTYLEKSKAAKALPYFEELVKAQPDNEEFKKGLEEARKSASLERLRDQASEAAKK